MIPAAVATWAVDLRPRLVRYAVRLARDEAAAEDLVQETFRRALRADFRGDRAAPYTYLCAILRNVFIDDGRRRSRRGVLEDLGAISVACGPDPVDEAERAERVRAAVASLPAGHRDAIAAIYFDGLGIAGAAEALGVPTGTIASRLFTARARLREWLRVAT